MTHRSTAWVLALLLSGATGCKEDRCAGLPPQVEIVFSLEPAALSAQVARLSVALSLAGAAARQRELTPAEASLAGGSGRFVVTFAGAAAPAGGEVLAVQVAALDSGGLQLAGGGLPGGLTLQPNGCNFGAIALVSGGDGGPGPYTIQLSGAARSTDLQLTGGASGDHLQAAAVCDLDGDGVDDLVLGAALAAGRIAVSHPSAGRVYVLLGRPVSRTAGWVVDLSETASVNTVVYGAQAGDRLGQSLACGDLDGDGVDDLVLGAPAADQGRGRAYVVLGGSGLSQRSLDLASGAADVTLRGDVDGDRLGQSLAVVRLDGTARAYLALGAPGADLPAAPRPDGGAGPDGGGGGTLQDAGAVFLFGGKQLSAGRALTPATASAVVTLRGGAAGERLGEQVAGGDLDGDGQQELAASGPGARRGTSRGAVRVLRGHDPGGGRVTYDCAEGAAAPHSLTLWGPAEEVSFGASLALGNLASGGGKSWDDLLVGAPLSGGGRVYLLQGDSTLLPPLGTPAGRRSIQAGDYKALFLGPASSHLGASLATVRRSGAAGGAVDLLVGAPAYDGARGAVFRVAGMSGYGAGQQVDVGRGEQVSLRVLGAESGHQLGAAVASGAVDSADAVADLLMVAPGAGGAVRPGAGGAYGILGQ